MRTALTPVQRATQEIIEKYDVKRPWERLESESTRIYNRFHMYLQLGYGRTLRAAYDACEDEDKGAFKTWQHQQENYNWLERAQAFDEWIMAVDRAEFFEERREWRKRRRKLLEDTYDMLPVVITRIRAKIADVDSEEASLVQLIKLLNIVLRETREEFGDKVPSSSHEIHVGVDQRQQKVEIHTVEVVKDHTEYLEGEID